MTDQDIINFFITSKGKINSNYVRNIDKYPQYKEYLLNRFVDEKCIKHIIWRIYYKDNEWTTIYGQQNIWNSG